MTSFARGQRLIGPATHYVDNQPPWRVDIDEYTLNAPLVTAVEAFGAGWSDDALREAGMLVGSGDFQRDAHLANTHTPVAHSHDRWGFRLYEVDYDPSYHRILGAAIARGAHTAGWADPRPGAGVARAAMFMLFAQVEPGHACPVSMTHAAVASIRDSPWIADSWLPRLYSREYEPRLLPPEQKAGALIGMAMTEKQGGPDVRAITTLGTSMGGNAYSITGHKWFCSAPMSDGVPRARPDAARQRRRGPDVPLRAARAARRPAERLPDPAAQGQARQPLECLCRGGVRGHRRNAAGRAGPRRAHHHRDGAAHRLDCVLGTAAGMRQSLAEAVWHARGRSVFGSPLVDQPAMTVVLADLALEYEAALLTGMRLARAFDADATDHDVALRRLATPVAKYWVCRRGPQHAFEALECLGGNGYTESFPLARRYREQPVMAIWEGSGNIIALDVLRALTRDPESAAAFTEEFAETTGASGVLDAHVEQSLRLLGELAGSDAAQAQAQARRLAEDLALALQGSLMLRYAPSLDAEAFIAARLGPDRGAQYGVLPRGTGAAAIVARH